MAKQTYRLTLTTVRDLEVGDCISLDGDWREVTYITDETVYATCWPQGEQNDVELSTADLGPIRVLVPETQVETTEATR